MVLVRENHYLVMMIVNTKSFSNPTLHNKVMGRTRTGFTIVNAQSLSADCDLDLWPNDMVLVATHYPVMVTICAQLFSNPSCMAKLRPGHDSETHTHTHTHTDRVNSICSSAIYGGGIINEK